MRALPRRYVLAVLAVGLIALAVLAWPAGAAGPWKAQIVDAETGQPLQGVVVLARWDKKTAAWPHPAREFHDIDEVVSDAEGRVVIPARDLSANTPLQAVVGPLITMFKPGYGFWTFRPEGPRPREEEFGVHERRIAAGWRQLAQEGAVVELPRVTTPKERLYVLDSVLPGLDVPPQKVPRMRAAYEEERARLERESRKGRP
jgi:hypothetical protein